MKTIGIRLSVLSIVAIVAFGATACGVHNAPAPAVPPTTTPDVELSDNVPTGHGVEVTFGGFEEPSSVYQRWTDPPATMVVPPRSTALR